MECGLKNTRRPCRELRPGREVGRVSYFGEGRGSKKPGLRGDGREGAIAYGFGFATIVAFGETYWNGPH